MKYDKKWCAWCKTLITELVEELALSQENTLRTYEC